MCTLNTKEGIWQKAGKSEENLVGAQTPMADKEDYVNGDLKDLKTCAKKEIARDGLKDDVGKLDLSILDYELIEPLIQVLLVGEKKYHYESWKKDFGMNYKRRFQAAMRRHDWESSKDPLKKNHEDGGVYHLAQVAINALFLLWHSKNEQEKELRYSKK
jgi:hypothetical protein